MNHHTLREMAKVGTGLVIADILSVLWFSTSGLLPLTILGVSWTGAMLPQIFVFDIALLFILVHYGWNMRLPIASPSERTLLKITGGVFLIVAAAHFLRLLFGWNLILGDFAVPAWLSWAGILLTLYLSYSSFHFARLRRR